MSDLEKDAKKVIDEFFSLEIVKKYMIAKDLVNKEDRLVSLKKEIVDSKKNLKNIPFEKRGEEVRRIKALEDKYDSDSLVVNYNELKEEVDLLVDPIREMFQF